MLDSLSLISVELGPAQNVTLAQLVDGWGLDVARFVNEASKDDMSRNWGAHDYFAALHLRGFAENAIVGASGDVQRLARNRLQPHDRALIDFTENDQRHLVRKFAGVQASRGWWWWERIPRLGLVREELEQWSAAAESE